MKRMVMGLWLCLGLIGCAVSAAVTAPASAALPELGRCVHVEGVKEGKKTVYHGNFAGKACTKEAPGTGRYEWSAGPGEIKEFSGAGAAEAVTLETVSKRQILCGVGRSEGEYTGATTETLTYVLNSCEEPVSHEPCQSLAPEGTTVQPIEGTIKTLPLQGQLGFIVNGTKPQVGWDVKPEVGPILVVFECGKTLGLGTKVTLEGSLVTRVKKRLDKMTEEFVQRYTATEGHQLPEQLEGGEKDTLTADFIAGLEESSEQIGYVATEEVVTEEPLEIKAKI